MWRIALILPIVLAFYSHVFVRDAVLYCCDNLAITIPAQHYLWHSLGQGIFPFWNPYIFSGTPFFADLNLSILYPLNVLFAVISPFRALTLIALFNVSLAASGMYVFAKRQHMNTFAAFLSGCLFGLSGTVTTYTNNISLLQVAGLAPWILVSLDTALRQPTGKRMVVAIVLVGLQSVSGHPQLFAYTSLFGLFYSFYFYGVSRVVRIWMPIYGIAVLLAAVQLVPFVELVLHSSRLGMGYEYATFDSLSPLALLRFIVPTIVGNIEKGVVFMQGGSIYGYIGAVGLILALFGAFSKQRSRFFAIAFILSLIVAFGKYTIIYRLIYVTPVLGQFRSPQHFLFIVTMALVILAGFGFDAIGKTSRLHKTIWAVGSVSALLGTALIVLGKQWLSVALASRWTEQHFVGLVQNGIFLTLSLGVLFFVRHRVVIFVLVIGELFLFGRSIVLTVPASTAEKWIPDSGIAREDEIMTRQLVDPKTFWYPEAPKRPLVDMPGEAAWMAYVMRPNINMLWGNASPDGYASVVLKNYKHFMSPNSTDPTGITFSSHTVLPPLAYWEDGQSATVSSWTAHAITVETQTEQFSKRLIVSSVYYPGWRVTIDDLEAPMVPYKDTFFSVLVPTGEHHVRFFYTPHSTNIGLALSVTGVACCVFVLSRRVRKKE